MGDDALDAFFGDIASIEASGGNAGAEEPGKVESLTDRTAAAKEPTAASTQGVATTGKRPLLQEDDQQEKPSSKKRKVIYSAPKSMSETNASSVRTVNRERHDNVKSDIQPLLTTEHAKKLPASASGKDSAYTSSSSSISFLSTMSKQASSQILPLSAPVASTTNAPQYAPHWYETANGHHGKAKEVHPHKNLSESGPKKASNTKDDGDEWPENDFRIFVGNLGVEVNSNMLNKAFMSKYHSVVMSKVIRDKRSNNSKGFGFVSFLDAKECANALRTMDGKYIGTRPVMLKVSDKNRNNQKRNKKKNRKGNGGRSRGRGGGKHYSKNRR